jgi:F-type H+-transporting ATPase subunit delta
MATSGLILRRYATALHELAQAARATDRVQADLAALGERLAGDPTLLRQLQNPRVGRGRKRELVKGALGQCHDLVRRTLLLLVDKGRGALLGEFAAVYGAVAQEAAGRQVAHVQSAAPLDDAMRQRLSQQLGQLTGKTVTLDEEVAAELLGGLRVVLGSKMIDGSVRRRLEQVRERMLRVPLNSAGAH